MRKIKNYYTLTEEQEERFNILVKEKEVLISEQDNRRI